MANYEGYKTSSDEQEDVVKQYYNENKDTVERYYNENNELGVLYSLIMDLGGALGTVRN